MEKISQPSVTASRNSSEVELLLCCVSTQVNPDTNLKIKELLNHDLNWAFLLKIARRHHVISLLHRSLDPSHAGCIPGDILNQLRQTSYRVALYNTLLTHELLDLLTCLEKNHIPAIPYKGPVLAASVYQDLGLRQFSDLDLLVKPEDFHQAQAVLRTQGYCLQGSLGWEAHFKHGCQQLIVDLHQRTTPIFFAFELSFEHLWSHLETLTLADSKVPQLQPEHLLLILCVNLVKDCCHWKLRLVQMCDVAQLLRVYPQLNWSLVLSLAKDLGCQRLLFLALCLVQDLLDVNYPVQIQKNLLAEATVRSLAAQVHTKLWEDPNPASAEHTRFAERGFWTFLWSYNHGFYLRVRERWQDKITYCLQWLWACLNVAVTPNQADWDLISLPKALHILYYPLHVVRLVLKHGIKPIYEKW